MLFPSPSTWKVAEDSPNHVIMNMIGLSQTTRKLHEFSDVPIFPVVLITVDPLQWSLHHQYDSTDILLFTFCVEVNKKCIWL